jgi:hypothetical protein
VLDESGFADLPRTDDGLNEATRLTQTPTENRRLRAREASHWIVTPKFTQYAEYFYSIH